MWLLFISLHKSLKLKNVSMPQIAFSFAKFLGQLYLLPGHLSGHADVDTCQAGDPLWCSWHNRLNRRRSFSNAFSENKGAILFKFLYSSKACLERSVSSLSLICSRMSQVRLCCYQWLWCSVQLVHYFPLLVNYPI